MTKALVQFNDGEFWDSTRGFSFSVNYAFEGDTSPSPTHNTSIFVGASTKVTKDVVIDQIQSKVASDVLANFNVILDPNYIIVFG